MQKKSIVFNYGLLILGSIIAAFALEKILVPAHIMDGGMVGIAMIISTLTKLPLGILTICLNLPLVWIGGRKLEKSFFIRTITAMAVFSVSLELFGTEAFHEIVITEDKLVSDCIRRIAVRIRVGLVLLNGGCLDGTEAVAILISKKFHFSVGQIILFFNILIYLTAGFIFEFDRALYSMLTYIIVSKVRRFCEYWYAGGKSCHDYY